jgi:RNA polymerase sigma factor (sigma-70 family)
MPPNLWSTSRSAADGAGIVSGGSYVGPTAGATALQSAQRRPRPDSDVHPAELRRLLQPTDPAEPDAAWDDFVARYSRLMLHVARRVVPHHDGAMDAYAHVIERLRRNEFAALRIYVADGRSQFTTWLTVVTRRMCVDFHRHTFGRPRGDGAGQTDARSRQLELEHSARRRLASFACAPVELTGIEDDRNGGPDTHVRADELHEALERAVAELPPHDRLLLKLRFEDDLAAQAIADALAIPSQFHVYRRLNAICAQLRKRLQARGVEGSTP